MLISKNWLQDFIEEKLPDTDKIEDAFIMHSWEVEGVEKVGEDDIFDVKILPDRAHFALSHRGIAREVVTLFNLNLKKEDFRDLPESKSLSISIDDPKLCRRYTGALIKGVKVGPSPEWLKTRLEAIGQKSINNIVDATNYVMYSLGQPLHAFDADKVVGGIVARAGKEGEKLDILNTKSLDVKDRVIELGKGECVIADDSGPLVLAGIKGGAKTAITDSTTNIILESANFDPVVTRKFSTIYNLRSETSKRFENEITPEWAIEGLRAGIDLIIKIAGGELEGIKDVYPSKLAEYKIGVNRTDILRLTGLSLSDDDILSVLNRLGLKSEKVKPIEKILEIAPKMTGIPYLYGSYISKDAPNAFDCSALVSWIYIQGGLSIPRISIDQYFATERVEKENLRAGDLVFSDTHYPTGVRREASEEYMKGAPLGRVIDHVGMCLGDRKILHTTRSVGHSLIEDIATSEKFQDIAGYGRAHRMDEERFLVTIPPERLDLRIKEDLVEEIGRIYGYDKVVAKRPKEVDASQVNHRYVAETIVREKLVSLGFTEVYTYVFRSDGEVELANAYASDKSHIRSNLRNAMNEALLENSKYSELLGLNKIKIFEIGNVFLKDREETRLCIGVAFTQKIKGETPEGEISKTLSEIIPSLSNIKAVNGVVEINFDEITKALGDNILLPKLTDNEIKKYEPISAYPFVVRDVAVWVVGENAEAEIEKIIKDEAGVLLKRLTKFDTFSKDGKTSYAYRLILQSMEKTLEEEEINKIMNSITAKMNSKEGWQVR